MKYVLISSNYGAETTGENGNYSCTITMSFQHTDRIAPDFTKDITVVSNNTQTGFEVDAQREKAINAFIESINIG